MSEPELFDLVGTDKSERCPKCDKVFTLRIEEIVEADETIVGIRVMPCKSSTVQNTAVLTDYESIISMLDMMKLNNWCPIMQRHWKKRLDDLP